MSNAQKECQHRVSKGESARNFRSGVKYSVTRNPSDKKPHGAFSAGSTGDLCQIKIDMMETTVSCELPNMGTDDCPIALYIAHKLTLQQANTKLREIYQANKMKSQVE